MNHDQRDQRDQHVQRIATLQGAPLDTPQLADLAFRVVDADGDGLVTVVELQKWVALALEHEVVDKELQFQGVQYLIVFFDGLIAECVQVLIHVIWR